MKKILGFIILITLLFLSSPACAYAVEEDDDSGAQASSTTTVLLSADFSGTSASANNWHIPTWTSDGSTYLGRTQLACSQNASLPSSSNGSAHITLSNYNPTMTAGNPSFYGTEIITNKTFTPVSGTILDVVVRAKFNTPAPGGIVAGMFFYPKKANASSNNEIDFELLTNRPKKVQTNVYANEPLGTGNPVFYSYSSGTITSWHTYEIKLDPGVAVYWYVDGKLVRTEKKHIPTGTLQFYINIWAPSSSWSEAYSSGISPVSSSKQKKTWSMDVDSVVIKAIKK